MLILLNLKASAQGFNEDSLYAVIKEMDDCEDKLDNQLLYSLRSNDIDKVREVSLEAYSLAEKLNKANKMAEAMSFAAWAMATGYNDYEGAMECLFKGLSICDTIGNSTLRIKIMLQLSSVFFNDNNYYLGLQYLEDANQLTEDSGDSTYYGEAAYLLARAYATNNMVNFAHEYYLKVTDYYTKKGRIDEAYIGAYGLAYNYLKRALNDNKPEYIDSAKVIADSILSYFGDREFSHMPMYQTLPLIYKEAASKAANKAERNALLQKAHSICDRGLETVSNNGQLMYRDKIKIAKAELLIEEGKCAEAKILIDEAQDESDTDEVMINYYKSLGDYEKMLEAMDALKRYKSKQAGTQYLASMNRNPVQERYLARKDSLENVTRQREYEKARTERHFKALTTLFTIIAIMVAFAGVVMAIQWRYAQQINKQMREHNNIIDNKNSELEGLINKVASQTVEIANQNDILSSQAREMQQKVIRLMNGLNYAKQIQTAVIPSRKAMEKLFGKCMIYYKPLEIVSGDFYWSTYIDGLKLLAVCDCTGHSVPGALLSILGTSFLYDIVSYHSYKTANAAIILNVLRDRILKGIGEECDDGMDMALIIYDEKNNRIHYAGAMRPLYLMRDGAITVYKPNRMPIGRYLIKDKPFTEQIIEPRKDDILYMFSDGMTDVFNADRSRKFSEKEFRTMLEGFNGMDFASQQSELTKFYKSWGSKSIIDDQVLIGIRI